MQLVLLFSTKPVRKTKKITFCSPLIGEWSFSTVTAALGHLPSVQGSILSHYYIALQTDKTCVVWKWKIPLDDTLGDQQRRQIVHKWDTMP